MVLGLRSCHSSSPALAPARSSTRCGQSCLRRVARPSAATALRTPVATSALALQLPAYNSSLSPLASYTSSIFVAPALPHVGSSGLRNDFAAQYVRGPQLGQGSFGTVFRGNSCDLPSGSEVAIKVMPKQRGKLTKEATMDKICKEVDFLERLQGCRGIVDVQDCFDEPHEILLVTELCSGGDLQKLSDTHAVISERCLALIAVEVLKVIQACNDHGMIHGDIKPANFVLKHPHRNPLFSTEPALAAASWLKAIDFGCSQQIPAAGTSLTRRAGTPVFMAPEIFARDYGKEADVWSAGILLYQVFSKRFPFWDSYEGAKAARVEEIGTAVCHADMRLDFGPWITMSPEGRHFIKGLLTRDPKYRLTVGQALSHPWLAQAISGVAPAAGRGGNNIVRSPAVARVVHSRVAQAA